MRPGGWTHTNVFAGGGLFATYNTVNPSTPHYHFSDWLGSQQVQAGASGGPEETCWNQPLAITSSVQVQAQMPPNITCPAKNGTPNPATTTSGARYYASSMGRFMSPDWDSSPVAIPYADRATRSSICTATLATNAEQN